MTDLEQLRNEILTEMYQEAEPPLDFMWAVENPDEMDEQWYKQHRLPQERQKEIFDKHIEDVELTDHERVALVFTCITSLGPSTPRVEQ